MPSYHRRVFARLAGQSLTVDQLDAWPTRGCRYPAARAVERLLRYGLIQPVAMTGPERVWYRAVPRPRGGP
jgi:hypothetical protein